MIPTLRVRTRRRPDAGEAVRFVGQGDEAVARFAARQRREDNRGLAAGPGEMPGQGRGRGAVEGEGEDGAEGGEAGWWGWLVMGGFFWLWEGEWVTGDDGHVAFGDAPVDKGDEVVVEVWGVEVEF